MALTNNTKFRRVELTINKKVNGSLESSVDFPKVHSITDLFGAFPAITEAALMSLTDAAYSARLTAFYDFLEQGYPFFLRNQVLNAASGTDAVLCPLDNSAAPVIGVTSFGAGMAPMNSSTYDNYLEWDIVIDQPAPQDIPYYFDVNLTDKNANIFRTERVHGIIPAGQTSHASGNLSIYIPEADDTMYAPVNAVAIQGTVDLNI